MAIKRKYYGLPIQTLLGMQIDTVAAIKALKQRGQSFTAPDMGMTFTPLAELGDDLAEINAAIQYTRGTSITRTVARLN
jgi:hypothetical protein